MGRILYYIQKGYRRKCSVGIVSGSYTGQVQLWIYRSAGLYTGRVQTWFSLCMVSLYIYRTGTGVDVVLVEFHIVHVNTGWVQKWM